MDEWYGKLSLFLIIFTPLETNGLGYYRFCPNNANCVVAKLSFLIRPRKQGSLVRLIHVNELYITLVVQC